MILDEFMYDQTITSCERKERYLEYRSLMWLRSVAPKNLLLASVLYQVANMISVNSESLFKNILSLCTLAMNQVCLLLKQ